MRKERDRVRMQRIAILREIDERIALDQDTTDLKEKLLKLRIGNSRCVPTEDSKNKMSPDVIGEKLGIDNEMTEELNVFNAAVIEITAKLAETLIAKNADYGNSFEESYKKHGLVSAVIRIEDKLNRLNNLRTKEAQVNESIDDTLLDLAGYAILTLITRKGDNHD